MAARTFRCADHAKCITLARANAERAWGARVRRDARYSHGASRTGGLSNSLEDPFAAVHESALAQSDIPRLSFNVRFWG
jgi:hypothetical protein